MKKILITLLLLLPSLVSAQVAFKINQVVGSTTSYTGTNPYFGLITGNGVGTSTLAGTTTPTFSAFVATSTTATSTLQHGLNAAIQGGCIAVNGTCLPTTGGGTLAPSMLVGTNASGNLTSTSTPTASHYLATSSIASILRYASTTAITATNASTTDLTVSNSFTIGGTATSTMSGNLDVAGNIEAGRIIAPIVTDTTGNVEITGNLTVTGNTTINSLTSTRLTFAGASGLLSDDSDLTFTAGNLLTATYASTTAITASGTASTTNLTVSSLTSAITLTGASGAFAEYTGTSCTNQAITVLSVLGAATCSSINNDYWSGTDLSVANGGTGLSTFGGTNTILYTTSADTLASEAAFTYNSTANRLTADYASTTALTVSQSAYFATASGNIGIGTTAPITDLHIKSKTAGATALSNFATTAGIFVEPLAASTLGIALGSINSNGRMAMQVVNVAGDESNDLVLQPYGGNVGIGTTSPTDILGLSTSATTTLHIGGTSTTQGSCVQMYSPNRTAYRLYVSNAGTLLTEAGTCR